MTAGRDKVIAALDLARNGEIDRGIRLLRQNDKQPKFQADSYYGLGLIELCLNNIENAGAYFHKAITVEPAHADSFYQLGKLADSLGDPLAATQYFEAAIGQRPGHIMATLALDEHLELREQETNS